jgi:hypothetical protein
VFRKKFVSVKVHIKKKGGGGMLSKQKTQAKQMEENIEHTGH